jgi:arginyl-tRNA synthetase
VAGAGYINARIDRAAAVRGTSAEESSAPERSGIHSLVEHTSINPNKAAHIGHLRNAILGDTFVRLLRAAGQTVTVQNYIDNTGVQVADVVVGFQHLEGKSLADVRALIEECEQRSIGVTEKSGAFDYLCWDLYARVSQWYGQGTEEENAARKKLRYATLHEIEHGGNDAAEIGEIVSTAVLRCHLDTMLRLGIEYDFLPRESEILHLKFWDAAFTDLKRTGVLYFENEGKNKGCWVMSRVGAETQEGVTDEDAKVIVRSNGTVTYVGKDISYHLWKFGLLAGKDFGYKPFFAYPDHECWISTEHGEETHPHFGGAQAIYNVIDDRQSDPQANVIQALRGMGYSSQADHFTHFSYGMVALTPGYAEQLGYQLTDEDRAKPFIEISGRKGFGVKADDLMDLMIAAAKSEVVKRHADWTDDRTNAIASKVAYGALRYYMLRFTRGSVIAFDQDMALSPEGETGPYLMYAAARIRSIFRKAGVSPEDLLVDFAGITEAAIAANLSGEANEDIWALWLRAARRTAVLDQCIGTSEPAHMARHAFQLAQDFSNFYHHHHILTEEDLTRKTFLLATAAIALRELVTVLSWLGIEAPEAM